MEKIGIMKLGKISQKYIIIEILKYVFDKYKCLTFLYFLNNKGRSFLKMNRRVIENMITEMKEIKLSYMKNELSTRIFL